MTNSASPRPPQPRDSFRCESRRDGPGVLRVEVAGELDLATVPQLGDALSRAVADDLLVILDLRELTFIDSTGLHAIVGAQERLGEDGRRLALVRGPPSVQRVFELTGVRGRLNFVEPADEIFKQAVAS